MINSVSNFESFIKKHTQPKIIEFVPEIHIYQASEITPIWQATETWLSQQNIDPPFWAFPWPGGQALARYILDHPDFIQEKTVLDFAAGCGIAAIASALSHAKSVEIADIDPLAQKACQLNAQLNQIILDSCYHDITDKDCRWEVILCGDICYEAPMTQHIWPWLKRCARQGADVIIADPGRAYLPKEELDPLYSYSIPTTLELEDQPFRKTTLYRFFKDSH